jgi:threonine synthase
MGLPVAQFLAANNENYGVYEYLQTGKYNPRPSIETIANATDFRAPGNFARILDLYGHSHEEISSVMWGFRYSNKQIRATIKNVLSILKSIICQ